GEAQLSFAGDGGIFHGDAAIAAARLSDHASPARFEPLQGKGLVSAVAGKWRGQLTIAGGHNVTLGTVSFRHDMASGAGGAHIDAPHLGFTQGGLQPKDLSPLLAQVRQTDGAANFQGDVAWTAKTIPAAEHFPSAGWIFSRPWAARMG
ncbi:MAG TPA: hypothetical protein VFA87_06530, partial [Rhizomicrobium sp.]|nr:hypothetical protein [Rhizomicrobium sp.]